jgi:class 3 adenylate cyclase
MSGTTRESSGASPPAEVCCVNCRAIYEYVLRRRPNDIDRLFAGLPAPYDRLPDPAAFILDENNWISSEAVVRLLENACRIVDDPDAAFEIGFESVTRRRLGYIQKFFVSTFMTVAGVARRVSDINAKLNTTKKVEVVNAGRDRMTVRLFWNPNGVLSRDICRYNQGIYSAIPTIWGLAPATVVEPHCHFRGDGFCEFECTWKPVSRARSIFENLFARRINLIEALQEIERDKELLKSKFREVSTLNRELQDKVEMLEAINKASRLLVSNVEEFLETTMRIVVDVLRFDRAILMLVDPSGAKLVYAGSAGADPGLTAALAGYSVPLSRDSNAMVRVLKDGAPLLVEDVTTSGLNPDNILLSVGQPSSFCLCPLVGVDNRAVGVLGADRLGPQPLQRRDLDYLSIFANTIAAFVRRAQLDARVAQIGEASGRFVPRELLDQLGHGSITDVRLGDQVQKEMAVLFSDIRSFTSLSETMTPAENFNFLNSYLSRVSPFIRKHNGFIDKYLGDGIMALFPGGAEDAVGAALDIAGYLPTYNAQRSSRGYLPIAVGSGIHAGTLMLGTIGEEARMEGTVIADAVNLASRLEGLTKVYGCSIIMSESALFGLSDPNRYNWRFLGKVRVKGKRKLVSVFEVFDSDADEGRASKAATREMFERAVHFFHTAEFRDADALLRHVLERNPRDEAAALLQRHSVHYAEHGVPPEWDVGIEPGAM